MRRRKKGVVTTREMGCPTPGKRGYETELDIRKNLSRYPEKHGHCLYQCKCNYWHVATETKEDQ